MSKFLKKFKIITFGVILMLNNSLKAQTNNSITTKNTKDSIEVDFGRIGWYFTETFNEEGPHKVKVNYTNNTLLFSCSASVSFKYLFPEKLKKEMKLPKPNWIELEEGVPKEIVFDKIKYLFILIKCPGIFRVFSPGKLKIVREFQKNYSDPYSSDEVLNALKWEMTDKVFEIHRTPRIVYVEKGAPPTLNVEYAQSKEVGFESTTGWSYGGSIGGEVSAFGLSADLSFDLQREISNSSSINFQQTESYNNGVNLEWEVCDTFLVLEHKVVQLGKVSSSRFGNEEPINFRVLKAQVIRGRSLCRKGDGRIADREYVNQIKEYYKAEEYIKKIDLPELQKQ